MVRKAGRKGVTKLSDSDILFGNDGGTAKWSSDLDLPTAPSSKMTPGLGSMMHGSTDGGYSHYNKESRVIPTEPPYTIFVGNLDHSTTQREISTLLKDINVKTIRLIEFEGRMKGFGYIELEDSDSLMKCLALDGAILQGRSIRIDVADPQRGATKPNSLNSFNNKGYSSQPIHSPAPDVPNWRRQDSVNPSVDSYSRGARSGPVEKSIGFDISDVKTFRSSPNMDGPNMDGPNMDGQRMDGSRMDGQRMDGQRMDGQRMDGPRMDGPRMDSPELSQSTQPRKPRSSPFGAAMPVDNPKDKDELRSRPSSTSLTTSSEIPSK